MKKYIELGFTPVDKGLLLLCIHKLHNILSENSYLEYIVHMHSLHILEGKYK